MKPPSPPPPSAAYDELMQTLPEDWARLSAGEDGEALAFAYIRAAYTHGYVAAFEEADTP